MGASTMDHQELEEYETHDVKGMRMTAHIEDGVKHQDTDHIQVSDSQQTRIRRMHDRHMLPIVCTLYVLSYLDRGNIGNAKTAGVDKALKLNSAQWTWVLNGFYLSYTLMEWTTICWKVFPAHIYVAVLCVLWGIAAMCAGAVHNMAGLVVCRVFLGVFEAGFGAGAPFFLSLFYQRRELAFRLCLLLGMSPLANCFAGALAYGITQIKNSIAPWRLLFLIEGAPTILFAPVVFFLLPDAPGMAKYLPEHERTQAVERMQSRDNTKKSRPNWTHLFKGILDYRNLTHSFIHFACNYSFAGLSNFLPTIIQHIGYTSINAQGLSAPVYFGAFLLCIVSALVSDRYGRRAFLIMGFSIMGMIGYLLLATAKSTGVRYLAIWLTACGVFPALCLNITWLANNNASDSKRGGAFSLLAVLGQTSSFLSSAVYPSKDAPYFVKGTAIGCAFTGSIAVMAFLLYLRLNAINKKKDELYGIVDPDAQYDVTELGDDHPSFRYML